MNQINGINLGRLTNSAHDSFMTEIVSRAKANEKVNAQTQTQLLDQCHAKEAELLKISQRNDLTSPISEADELRDKYYIGYKNAVKGYLSMPEGDLLTAAEKLQQHIDDYKIDTRGQLDEETSDLSNLIVDLEGKLAAEIATIGLSKFVENMKAANEQVRALLQQRDDDGPAIEVGALKAARADTDESYRDLIVRVNALWITDYDDLYDQFITETNRQIARFKEQLKTKKKSDTPTTTK